MNDDLEKDGNDVNNSGNHNKNGEGGDSVKVMHMHSVNTSLKSPIRKCIKIVSRKPEKDRLTEGAEFSGYLNVKKRNLNWKRRWVVLNKGNGKVSFFKNDSVCFPLLFSCHKIIF